MENFYIWCIILTASILVTVSTVMFHFIFLDKVIDYQIGQELALKNGSAAWDRWVNLPVPIYLKVYLFIVTNPEDISKGGKPILKEQGPYVYREIRKKKDINVNTLEDTITYGQEILFSFDKDNSANYTENDEVTVINPAIMAIVKTLYNIKPLQFIANWFDFAVPSMFNSPKSVFLTTTVKKLLFDGEKIKCSHKNPNIETLLVCSALQNLLPMKVLKLTDNGDLSFALLRHKNGSGVGELEINAGIKKPKLLGQISKWNKLNKLSTWSGDYCNTVGGNEMTLITPYQNENSRIKLFSTDICRSVVMEYNTDVVYEDIPGLRYVFSPSFLQTPEHYPNNLCYCNTTVKGLTTPSPCLPYGALDISGCLDVPVTLTKPHFMDVDPHYTKGIIGLQPDHQKHSTFLDIEPRTGIPLQGYQRVQFNILMENISSIEIMEKLPTVLFPLMWIEEGSKLGKKEIDMLKDMIIDKLKIVNVIMWTIILLGVATIILSIIFILRNTKRKVS